MISFGYHPTLFRDTLKVLLTVVVMFSATAAVADDSDDEIPTIEQKTDGMTELDGFFPVFWDAAAGRLYLEIGEIGTEFLYVNALATGIGSNPIGLDRGRMGRERVVHFERVGPRLLLVERNLYFRAVDGEPSEKRAVSESFAESILWGGEIVAQSDHRLLVDWTDMVLSDAADVAGQLRRRGQGSFERDSDRCALYMSNTRAFKDNTEIEAVLTFVSDDPGELVRETTPTPEAVTVRQRHSLVRLPDDDYEPRRLHPRCGMFHIEFADYTAEIEAELSQRWVMRHRLQKKDPNVAVSEPVEPIVYYVDRAIPEPIRSAVLEGAGWWAEAFEAAGFKDGFRVELAPEGMDYLDLRHNVIQWVHRSTRGWSYGRSVVDPRTGEILKGHVSLGSLRVRQDHLLMEGLSPQYDSESSLHECAVALGPTGEELAAFDPAIAPTDIALARIKQLACHEIGHTLGLAHNFAASTYDRGSVMDYPAPLAEITEAGTLDLGHAYSTGMGIWDLLTVRYAYSQFAEGADEDSALAAIVREAIDNNLIFMSDADSRSGSAAHPLSNLWDNGADPIAELDRVMAVRRIGLDKFSENSVREGAPLSRLEEMLVPLYLSHRYQLDATAKAIGGYVYTYAMRGDGQTAVNPVPTERQRAALEAMLRTVTPSELVIDDRILSLLPPQAYGYYDDRERFERNTGRLFDPLAAAEVAARMTISTLLNPQRAARLVNGHAADVAALSLRELIDRLVDATWRVSPPPEGHRAVVARAVQCVVVDELLQLAGDRNASEAVRNLASFKLSRLAGEIDVQGDRAPHELQAHINCTRDRIQRFLDRPHAPAETVAPLTPPPGSPIGAGTGQ